jgi:hypothetical protein
MKNLRRILAEEGLGKRASSSPMRRLERELDKLVVKMLGYAELDDASEAIQTFIDALSELDDMAREDEEHLLANIAVRDFQGAEEGLLQHRRYGSRSLRAILVSEGFWKTAHRPHFVNSKELRAGHAFMTYKIDAAANNSKFYEGKVTEALDGTWSYLRRWGDRKSTRLNSSH